MNFFKDLGKGFTKMGNTVAHTTEQVANTVAQTTTQTANTVAHTTTNVANTVAHKTTQIANTVADGVTNTAETIGSVTVHTANDVVDNAKKIVKEGEQLVLKELGDAWKDIAKAWAKSSAKEYSDLITKTQKSFVSYYKTPEGKSNLTNMKANYKPRAQSNTSYIAHVAQAPEIQEPQNDASSNDFQTISLGIGMEGALGIGAEGGAGEAAALDNLSVWNQYVAVGGVIGAVGGASMDCQLGFWKDPPKDIKGEYIGVEGRLVEGLGANVGLFFHYTGKFLGFVVGLDGGVELELAFAAGYTWTSQAK